MRQILLIMIGCSLALQADFIKSRNMVADDTSSLQWQDNEIVTKTWTAAIDYCEALSLDGYSDWRLPNLNELTSLVDDSKTNPALDTAFEHSASNTYWSSTTYAGASGNAWIVYFSGGNQSYGDKADSHYVRCVRAGR